MTFVYRLRGADKIEHDRTNDYVNVTRCIVRRLCIENVRCSPTDATRLESLIVVVPSLKHLHGQIEMLIWKLPRSEAAGASRCFGLASFSTFTPSIEFSPFFSRSSRIWTITDFSLVGIFILSVCRSARCHDPSVTLRRPFSGEEIEFLGHSSAERSFRNNNSIMAGPSHTKEAGYRDRSESGALPEKGNRKREKYRMRIPTGLVVGSVNYKKKFQRFKHKSFSMAL